MENCRSSLFVYFNNENMKLNIFRIFAQNDMFKNKKKRWCELLTLTNLIGQVRILVDMRRGHHVGMKIENGSESTSFLLHCSLI